ncbi:MAG: DMT family transporter [Bacillota bacterium]|nr:DMT family transporter [Bacillota bacterium]
MKKKRIYFLMTLCALFWSGAFIAAKLSSPYIPPFTLTFLRFSLATIFLFGIAKIKKVNLIRLSLRDIPVFLFTGIIGMIGYHVLFFLSVRYTSAVNASFIGASNPIITSVLCMVTLKEMIDIKRFMGIILSFTGVLMTLTNGNFSVLSSLTFNKGDLLMLLAVCIWAVYSIFSKIVMKSYDPFNLTFYTFLFCTIFLIPALFFENPLRILTAVPGSAFLAVLYMAIFPTVIGYLVQQYSIKQIGPSKTSIFINLVPIFSTFLSVLILGENLVPVKILMGFLIISGVYITQKN